MYLSSNLKRRISTNGKASVILCLALCACSSGGGTAEESGAAAKENFGRVLETTAQDVILATYSDLHAKARGLRE
jgi:hypothetical protein